MVRFSGPPAVVAPEVDDRVPAPVTPIRWANATLFVPAPTFSTTFAAPTMVDPFNQVLFCDSPRLDAGAAQPDPTAVVDEFGVTGHPAGQPWLRNPVVSAIRPQPDGFDRAQHD